MKGKKIAAVFLAVIMLTGIISSGLSASAILTVETQYSYDAANPSWLKDMIIKEDMTSIGGMSERVEFQAKAKYPYRETAESFSEEISYYKMLYTLDENMANAAYLYLLDLAESFAQSAGSGYSDEFIRSYLESLGIVYPSGNAGNSTETKIVARAFFAIVSKDDGYVVSKGAGLYEAFTAYLSTLLGVSGNSIIKFDSDANLSSLKEYVLAACKYVLFSAGYSVSADTPEEEVYRLIAIMTIRAQGISIDSATASFSEIKNKYLCAMMCKIYGVSIDTASFESAAESSKLDFYMLQLIGKKNGVTVKDSLSYDEAFKLVCEKTDYFNIEKGEFYADIYEYDVPLKYKRGTIWIYPQTLGVTSESDGTSVSVSINGSKVRENYYSEVKLDSEKSGETVMINVDYTDANGKKSSSSYKLNVIQGSSSVVQQNTVSKALSGVKDVVQQVLEELGMDSSIAGIVKNIPFELPQRFLNITSLLIPNFGSGSAGSGFLQKLFGYAFGNDSNVDSDKIGGVGGLDSFNGSNSALSMDFTVNGANVNNFNAEPITNPTPVINPADSLVIQDNSPEYPPLQIADNGNFNWFKELMSDTPTVIVLCAVLVAAFVVCFMLFSQLLKGRVKESGDVKRSGKREKNEKVKKVKKVKKEKKEKK